MYNFIVTGFEGAWDGKPYKLELNRVVREYTDDAIVERFKTLNEEAVRELRSFPALFAYEQGQKADARIGSLRRISSRSGEVRIEYELSSDLPAIPSSELAKLTGESARCHSRSSVQCLSASAAHPTCCQRLLVACTSVNS